MINPTSFLFFIVCMSNVYSYILSTFFYRTVTSGIRGISRSSSSVIILYTKISTLIKLIEMQDGNGKKFIKQTVKAYEYHQLVIHQIENV